jgi:hypothetical protein
MYSWASIIDTGSCRIFPRSFRRILAADRRAHHARGRTGTGPHPAEISKGRPAPPCPRSAMPLPAMRLLPLSALLAAAGTGSRTAATHTHALPVPTRAQLAWQKNEIMALIHFNMATFFQNGDPGCTKQNWAESQKPASFAPVKLNVSQWIDSMRALGVKEAVLTAKHGCGFLLWPTASRLPNASPYAYHVPPGLNVLQQFSEAMEREGLGHGFYYSLTNNFYLNVRGHYVQNGTLLPGQQQV